MTSRTPRLAQPKLWTGLMVAGTAMGLAASPLAAESFTITSGPEKLWFVASEGGEGGEGGAAATDAEGAPLPMVTQLGLLEGTLRSGAELARAGDAAAGLAHVKTLVEDRYEPVESALEKYKAPGFEDALETAIADIAAAKPAADISASSDTVFSAIAVARAADMEAPEWFQAVMFLTRKAGEEYGKGVTDGKLTDAGEYQESWGNVQAARAIAADLAASTDATVKSAGDAAVAALDEVNAAFGGILADGALTGDESLFAAAAAKVELAAFKVK